MKATILNGGEPEDMLLQRVQELIQEYLQAGGVQVEPFLLARTNIAYCLGDFLCWVRTPGVCALDDDNRTVAAAVAQSDVLILLTPVTFGGYSSESKKAIDHLIQIASPFFMTLNGETHHKLRYEHSPALFVVGTLPDHDEEAESILRELVARNAINFHSTGKAFFVYRNRETDPSLLMILEELESWTKQPEPSFS